MKKYAAILAFVFSLCIVSLYAQDQPAPSPFSKVEQKVGLTDVTIEYSRPSMKDRVIFGGLLKYDEKWRTGANAATKITFSDAVTVEGNELSAGSYALFTVPGEDSWDVMLYEYTETGTNVYNDVEPVLEVSVEPTMLAEPVETLLINIDNLRDESATLEIIWEKTLVPIKLGV